MLGTAIYFNELKEISCKELDFDMPTASSGLFLAFCRLALEALTYTNPQNLSYDGCF